MGYLSNAGLSYFFGKLKTIFAPISHGHGGATQSAAGFMSAADKKKIGWDCRGGEQIQPAHGDQQCVGRRENRSEHYKQQRRA